jgi:hypothetical protein
LKTLAEEEVPFNLEAALKRRGADLKKPVSQ